MGMKTMDNDLLRLPNGGQITPVEAYRKASKSGDFDPFIDSNAMPQMIAGT